MDATSGSGLDEEKGRRGEEERGRNGAPPFRLSPLLLFSPSPLLLIAQGAMTPTDESSVEGWLSAIIVVVIVLVVGLLGFALTYRLIARRTTRPCPACMEFISKKVTVCPRCGKAVASGK